MPAQTTPSAADERAPLLVPPRHASPLKGRPKRLSSALATAAIALLSLLFAAALFLVLLGASFKPTDAEIDSLQRTAFRYSTTPDSLSVREVTADGVLLDLTVRCGIDGDRALGVGLSEADARHAEKHGYRGAGAEWWEAVRLWVARRGAAHIHTVRVIPGRVQISEQDGPPLLEARLSTLDVPFITGAGAAASLDWLRPMHLTVLAKPIAATDELWAFAQRGWAAGQVNVRITADGVAASIPGEAWWKHYASMWKDKVVMQVSAPIARLPGLPLPGKPFDIAQLVKLEEYHFDTKHGALRIEARASLPNPYPLNYTMPLGLPFAVSLADGKRVAEVVTEPVDMSTFPIHIRMAGRVVKVQSDISLFLQNYLHGLDNPIIVDGMSALKGTPRWILDILSTISVPLMFPGPRPPPKIIRSVTIERMRISESGGKMRASGLVIAQIDLPRGMERVEVDVQGVLPDVVIYDGPVADDRAFGHIRPDSYLNSTTSPSDDPFNPHRLIVRAPIENVPVDILPGKDRILSDFVSRIVFKGGALAGIEGNASVEAAIVGIDVVQLHNLPVQGETWVGRS